MSELIYVTAQPDVPYFHWQAEVYGHNFVEKGIKPEQIHIIFGIYDGSNNFSEGGAKLREKGYNVHFYPDKRFKKHYIPSVKPYLISKWLEQYPENGKVFFLHDADIIFRENLKIEQFLNDDDTCYLSDTVGYIGYEYLKSCSQRYKTIHPELSEECLIDEMLKIIKIDKNIVQQNQLNSGGGQYIIKNTDFKIWDKIYNDSTKVYDTLQDFHKKYPIPTGEVQFWTAEMWSLLWNLWFFGKKTKIIKELDFCWATDLVQNYYIKPILHMAGILDSMKSTKFYKGDFITTNPLDKIRENKNYFDYVDSKSATIKYVEVLKSVVEKNG